MGKRSKNKNNPAAADVKRCRRAFRTLDLVDSRLDVPNWAAEVGRRVGEETVDAWFERNGYDDVYDFSYDSFEHAMHFSVGWRSSPLAEECEWLLPRLRSSLSRKDETAAILVEIGAGAGATAAIVSAALQVPVIAIDSHPKTKGLAEQFAERTGGTVESHVADISDLELVLDGRTPAAVFGLGIYRHLQPHAHGGGSFSYSADMQRILSTHRVEANVESFIASLNGADLLLIEMMCHDYLAEMASGLFPHGYDIPRAGIHRIDGATPEGPTTTYGIHFTKAVHAERNPNLLIEMFSPLPHVSACYASDPEDGRVAEALRLSLEPTELIEAAEVRYTDGSGRLRWEVFGLNDRLAGHYTSTTRNFRSLRLFPRKDADEYIAQLRQDGAAATALGQAEILPCTSSGVQWGCDDQA